MADRTKRRQKQAAGTFTLINQMALTRLIDLLQHWLPGGRQEGSEWIARNPRRTDHHPGSFKINVRSGVWADFATDDKGGDAISLLAYLRDVPQSEAARLLALELRNPTTIKAKTPSASLTAGGGVGDIPSEQAANVQTLGCTLEDYACIKALPQEFLKDQGLSEITYQGSPAVRIPYRDEHGQEIAIRFRTALVKSGSADNRFRWKNGAKPCLYGLSKLEDAPAVVLVEGESDCHTLWYHSVNAVGLPGASLWNERRDAPHLLRYETIFVVVEPDQGGEVMLRWIEQSALRDRVHLVRLAGFKDPSAMHLAGPEQFLDRWQEALANSAAWADMAKEQQTATRDDAWRQCQSLAKEPDILERFSSDLQRAGAVGVEREGKLLYLAVTSRVLDRPISIAVKGPSSAGKSYLVETVLSFFCASSYYALTAMSERALAYGQEPLQHRMLVLYEADGMNGDVASYLIRSLLSEGCVRYEAVEKTPEGLRSRLIERPGPTGLIVTTTRDGLHPENETRLISITLVDTPSQTRAILDALALEDHRDEVDPAPWIALQQWIASSDARVTIPFARDLVRLVPEIAVRLRRDIKLLLNLIRTHALLHQASRERDDKGRVVAILQDYAAVRTLIAEFMAEGVQAMVPDTIRETVAAVASIQHVNGPATVSEVAARLNLDNSSAWRRCAAAAGRGYLRNEQSSRRKPARYVIGDPLPEEQVILPAVETLTACMARARVDVCTFADDLTGNDTPPPLEPVTERRRLAL